MSATAIGTMCVECGGLIVEPSRIIIGGKYYHAACVDRTTVGVPRSTGESLKDRLGREPTMAEALANANDDRARLRTRVQELEGALRAYKDEFPAFRSAPVGAPGSIARRKQDDLIKMEDAARAALAGGA